MIHHIVLFELQPETEADVLENLVRGSRSLLLKIPEVLNVRSGRNLDPSSSWAFFVALEVDSLDKLRIVMDNPWFLKFFETWVRPHLVSYTSLNFELDPSRDLKYS